MKGRTIKGGVVATVLLLMQMCASRADGQEKQVPIRLSMDAAVETALTSDYGAERAEIQTKIAHERVRNARGNLLPNVTLNTTLETDRDPYFRTQINQPLYHAEDWQLIDQRQAEEERSRVTEEDVRDRVAYDTKQMYANLLLEQELQSINYKHLGELERIKRSIKKDSRHLADEKIVDGLLRKLENNIEKQNLSLQTQVRAFYFRMHRTDCGYTCPSFALTEQLDVDGLRLDQNTVVATALEYRTKPQEQNVRVHEENLQREKATLYPTLDSYVYRQESFVNNDDLSTPAAWQVGVIGRWNFDFKKNPARAEARYYLDVVRNQLAEHKAFVGFFAGLALEQYETADKVINPDLAVGDQETYEQTFAEYFDDTDRSFNDVNIALENAINSERQLIRDYANRLHRKIDLEYNMGLSEEGLKIVE